MKNHDFSKVAIVGAGFVGSSTAYSMLIQGVTDEIALIDIHKEKARGEAMDLEQGLQFVKQTDISYGGDYKLCKNADIIVICAGAHQKPGETRLDLIQKNASIFKQMIPAITKHNKKAILLVVSNPLDVLTYLTLKYSKFPKNRVFGTGTTLDTARLRFFLGEHYGVSPKSVHAFMLGEHGDSEFPAWSTANIAGVPLNKLKKYSKKSMDRIFKKTKKAAYEVIAKKGATYYAIGLGITRIVKAILHDKNEVVPASSLLKNYHGVSNVCLSVPCIINRKGIKEQLVLPLDSKEKKLLRKSASIMKKYIKSV